MLLRQTIPALQVKANLSNAESHKQRQPWVPWRLESVPDGSRDRRATQQPNGNSSFSSHSHLNSQSTHRPSPIYIFKPFLSFWNPANKTWADFWSSLPPKAFYLRTPRKGTELSEPLKGDTCKTPHIQGVPKTLCGKISWGSASLARKTFSPSWKSSAAERVQPEGICGRREQRGGSSEKDETPNLGGRHLWERPYKIFLKEFHVHCCSTRALSHAVILISALQSFFAFCMNKSAALSCGCLHTLV